jgi:hypothetical protein
VGDKSPDVTVIDESTSDDEGPVACNYLLLPHPLSTYRVSEASSKPAPQPKKKAARAIVDDSASEGDGPIACKMSLVILRGSI